MEGLTTDVNNLICNDYTDEFIKADEETATDCFEWAIREAQEAEQQKQQAQFMETQKHFEDEKKMMEMTFRSQFLEMKKAEEEKVEELKKTQNELLLGLQKKEEEKKKFEEE